ncbi:MAG: hypothetical protein JF628_10720 [Sphingomonas sp.]|nr:hypothetical protein [Sphingomonas sp.]
MSFRYKSALLSLVSMGLIYAWYFTLLVIHFRTGHPFNPVSHLIGTIVLLAVVQILGHILIVGTSSDKYDAMDERERGFDRRATQVGYYVLIVGALLGIGTLHLGFSGPMVGDAVLFAIVFAECTRQGMFLFAHHRAA